MGQSVSSAGVPKGRSLAMWAVICALAGMTYFVYVGISANIGSGNVIMPLDDAYIHFQYAHQIARGQVYVYNPGLPPTSGATSFLYPYVLAAGDFIGFRGLSLGYWAMGVGALALAITSGLIWQTGRRIAPNLIAWLVALAFMLNGAVAWHFMSGMETGLAILFTLLTLYGVIAQRQQVAIAGATLNVLTRPEGAILGGLVVIWMGFRRMHRTNAPLHSLDAGRRLSPLLLLPLMAILIQPIVNWLVTGSAVATGNSAKSLFGVVPFELPYIIGRIWENFSRMAREAFELRDPVQPFYLGIPLGILAIVGFITVLIRPQRRGIGLLVSLWMIGTAAAISTLDTAFWHFKRYQLPMIAGLYVVALFGIGWLSGRFRFINAAIALASLVFSGTTALWFAQSYAVNVTSVVAQPLQMANWLRLNAPANALIAVHDVGMMRYQGGHTTLDMVGLTTPGAADYWRNGPGSVGELLIQRRPALIASYGEGHGLGLGFLQQTSLYAETLASYTVTLDDSRNVALAAATQGIYQPDYTPADRQSALQVLPSLYPIQFDGVLLDSINVAEVQSERAHGYQWTVNGSVGGFPTDFYQFNAIGCDAPDCEVMDGGRRINGSESFTLTAVPNQDAILVTRLHPANGGTFDVYVNEQFVGTRVVPLLPGAWLEVPTYIPSTLISSDMLNIRIVAHVAEGAYMPYYHWLYSADALPDPANVTPLTEFQDGAIQLLDTSAVRYENGIVTGEIDWYTLSGAHGDYAYFVHVYAEDNLNTVMAQTDSRPGRGMLPPGNWLPGMIRDTISIQLNDLPAGSYRVAVGLYNPATFARLTPMGGDEQNRFWWDRFEIP